MREYIAYRHKEHITITWPGVAQIEERIFKEVHMLKVFKALFVTGLRNEIIIMFDLMEGKTAKLVCFFSLLNLQL